MDNRNVKEELKDGIGIVVQPLLDFFSPVIFGASMASTAVPSICGIILGYKQHRTEKMLKLMREEIYNRVSIIESKLKELEVSRYNQIKDVQWGIILDYVIDNNQEEKILYMANGFESLIEYDSFSDDMLLTLYDTLKSLNILDLKIFDEYCKHINNRSYTFDNVIKDLNINREQLDLITKKLIREGLITQVISDEVAMILERIQASKSLMQKFDYSKPDTMGQILGDKYRCELSGYGEEFRTFFAEKGKSK